MVQKLKRTSKKRRSAWGGTGKFLTIDWYSIVGLIILGIKSYERFGGLSKSPRVNRLSGWSGSRFTVLSCDRWFCSFVAVLYLAFRWVFYFFCLCYNFLLGRYGSGKYLKIWI